MSGALSFVLGLLGLSTAAGIDLGQSVSQKRKEAESSAAQTRVAGLLLVYQQ